MGADLVDVGALQPLRQQVTHKACILACVVLCVSEDEVALEAQVRRSSGCGAAVVGLYAAYCDDGVVAVCEGFRHEELEFADLWCSCGVGLPHAG